MRVAALLTLLLCASCRTAAPPAVAEPLSPLGPLEFVESVTDGVVERMHSSDGVAYGVLVNSAAGWELLRITPDGAGWRVISRELGAEHYLWPTQ